MEVNREEGEEIPSKAITLQARSVVVEGLPSGTTQSEIIIYFQKKKNNGGDVEDVKLNGEEALVVFESADVAENVLLKEHTINGASVTVKSQLSVFTKVTAVVCSEDFCHSDKEIKQLLMKIKKLTNIDLHFASYGLLLSGTFEQISASRKVLQGNLRRRQNYDSFEGINSRSCVEQSDEDGYETDKAFMEMFHVAYKQQLDEFKAAYRVDIVQYQDKDGKMKVNLKPTNKTKESLISQARSDFIGLYQKAYQNSRLVRFSACQEKERKKLREVVKNIKENFSVIVNKCEDRVSYQIYGDKTIVHEALEMIDSQVEIVTDAFKVHGARPRQRQQSAHNDAGEPMDVDDDPRNLSVDCGSVKISVMKGDITDQHVDTIVNAANEDLLHGGGVAGAIVKKGGYEIQDESHRVVRHHGPVKVGDVAVTNSGRLPCNYIIHAVGPKWDVKGKDKSKELLWKACINSLREAESLKCESIALPAISSGIFGMPKEISAQVMFTAVKDYACNHQPALKDIRFVIIDDPTFDVFRKEFDLYYLNFNNRSQDDKSARNSKENEQRAKKERRPSKELYSAPTANQHVHDNMRSVQAQNNAFVHEKVSKHPLDEHSKGDSDRKLYSSAVTGTPSSAATAGNATREGNVSDGDKQLAESRNNGLTLGNQPDGEMTWWEEGYCLPGYEKCGRIVIEYYFPSGIQGPEHPNPGRHYSGTTKHAFLPACKEGWDVLQLLRKAFDARLVFRVGRSANFSRDDQIIWNDIHHKTSFYAEPQNYGYPDPTYLSRVKKELAAKGIY